jgi:uncharacterized protein YfaS (alpha-2-macroglobulin family)
MAYKDRKPVTRLQGIARWLPLALILVSLACALPFGGQPTPTRRGLFSTPTLPPSPTPTPAPLPPDLVESDPPQNAELPLDGPITLFFNQPMDRASVEAALSSQIQQPLQFNWVDDSTVIVYLGAPLEPETQLVLELSDAARSAQGKPLLQPISLKYKTAGYLRLVQSLPEPEAVDVDPSAPIVAAFNRPIVPLGADPAAQPAAFTLEPAVQGRGEWLNTSTYVFYPQPALAGGVRYTAVPNPDLKSTDGGPLTEAQPWSFTTVTPKLLSVEPETEVPWRLDAKVVLTFNQPMNRDSVAANFSLVGADGTPVAGAVEWSQDDTVFTFTPSALLARGANYIVTLNGAAQGLGGASLGQTFSASVMTVAPLRVVNTEPAPGQPVDPRGTLSLYFSAPVNEKTVKDYITISPQIPDLNYYFDAERYALGLYGYFNPNQTYTLSVSPQLTDIWGGPLAEEFNYTFTTRPYAPNISLVAQTSTIFLTPQDPSLVVQAVNISSVPLSVGRVPLDYFIALLGPNGYELQDGLLNFERDTWTQSLSVPTDRMQTAELFLRPDQQPLQPGIYFLRFEFDQPSGAAPEIYAGPYLLIVSNLQVTFKVSATEALAWVVDLRTNQPVANAPVTIYTEAGAAIAQGITDSQGVYRGTYEPLTNVYEAVYAVVGQPGDNLFGMALSAWSVGIEPWDFGIPAGARPPGLKAYFYTDRPIYRPGQKVFFRAIVRQAYNGRYSPPDVANLPVTIYGPEGQQLADYSLSLSPLGTAHGEFTLPSDARPGSYAIMTPSDDSSYLGFLVASYRKPEINLQVSFSEEQTLAGETLSALVNARYFFDAPAGNVKLRWGLYRDISYFGLPGYQVGPEDTSWLLAFRFPNFRGPLGDLVEEGEATTEADGTLRLEFPTKPGGARQRYTLEVTATDESGLPVSARGSIEVNPDEFYIGVRPDTWVSRAGEAAGFEVQVVDWLGQSGGARSLRAEFKKVRWNRVDPQTDNPEAMPEYVPEYTPVGSTDFTTGSEGKARLAFTPPDPGTYMLDVYNVQAPAGAGARTQVLLWVGGPGQAIWPNLPNSRLRLVADRAQYQPGDTAQIFIPNNFGAEVQALLTIERSTVIEHQVITVGAQGYSFSLPLTAEHAPNVYLSVTLLGRNAQGQPDFRQGYLNLPVEPLQQTLQVTLLSSPQRAGPGDPVTFEIQVNDSTGNPVQGEFSLAVVDLAVLALAEPNSPDIVSAFYSQQPIGVRTSLALAAYNRRELKVPAGMGGGGGEAAPEVARQDFPDTAYWNAEIVTGPDGKAQVSLNLPDTLTTWQVETRGVTQDTRVGQSQAQVVATKELLVRPVTPRFLVVNDHAQVAAIIQNNTAEPLQVEASLQANGFVLDDPAQQTQQVSVPAQGRARVEWWGTAQDVPSADLVFSAQGGGLQDAARLPLGSLPVLRFLAPQTYRTSGTMDAAGEIIELISLPRSFEAQNGQLEVELSPSLAAAMIRALEALETYPFQSTEQLLSTFLANLETYRTLQDYGIDDPGLKARLDRALNDSLQRLKARHNFDGGWPWWQEAESDPYITAYVLFGLLRARQAGITINQDTLQRAIDYLKTAPPQPAQGETGAPQEPFPLGGAQQPDLSWPPQPWGWDRLAFQQYVLAEAEAQDMSLLNQAYQERDQLSPWAQAILALAFEKSAAGSPEARTLLSDLQTNAIRSSTGAYWEMPQTKGGPLQAGMNMHSNLSNTAVVLYALAQRDPGAPLVADVVRYLMANRGGNGAWASTYTTAWTLIALNQVIKSTGELAGNFGYDASLNGNPLAQGKAGGAQQTTPVTAQTPIQRLYPDYPNALTIRRDGGQGRLYYAVGLNVSRAVEDAAPLSQGLTIGRSYLPYGVTCPGEDCTTIQSAKAGEKVTVRLSLTLPHDMYHLAVSDYIPAGAEILDTSLKTTQLGFDDGTQVQQTYDPRRPFKKGWGWWFFSQPMIYDDHIAWTARYLPAGSYELTYTLVLLQPGEYRAIPARSWQLYFPEVQANSAGDVFQILP